MRRIAKLLFFVLMLGIFVFFPTQIQAKTKIMTPAKVPCS